MFFDPQSIFREQSAHSFVLFYWFEPMSVIGGSPCPWLVSVNGLSPCQWLVWFRISDWFEPMSVIGWAYVSDWFLPMSVISLGQCQVIDLSQCQWLVLAYVSDWFEPMSSDWFEPMSVIVVHRPQINVVGWSTWAIREQFQEYLHYYTTDRELYQLRL